MKLPIWTPYLLAAALMVGSTSTAAAEDHERPPFPGEDGAEAEEEFGEEDEEEDDFDDWGDEEDLDFDEDLCDPFLPLEEDCFYAFEACLEGSEDPSGCEDELDGCLSDIERVAVEVEEAVLVCEIEVETCIDALLPEMDFGEMPPDGEEAEDDEDRDGEDRDDDFGEIDEAIEAGLMACEETFIACLDETLLAYDIVLEEECLEEPADEFCPDGEEFGEVEEICEEVAWECYEGGEDEDVCGEIFEDCMDDFLGDDEGEDFWFGEDDEEEGDEEEGDEEEGDEEEGDEEEGDEDDEDEGDEDEDDEDEDAGDGGEPGSVASAEEVNAQFDDVNVSCAAAGGSGSAAGFGLCGLLGLLLGRRRLR